MVLKEILIALGGVLLIGGIFISIYNYIGWALMFVGIVVLAPIIKN